MTWKELKEMSTVKDWIKFVEDYGTIEALKFAWAMLTYETYETGDNDMTKTHDFVEDLRDSMTPFKTALAKHILKHFFKNDNIDKVIKNDIIGNDGGCDFWVVLKDGTKYAIDAKFRTKDYRFRNEYGIIVNDDLVIETWSNRENKTPGWLLSTNKRTDFVLWVWVDTGRTCLIPYTQLRCVFKNNFDEWTDKYYITEQSNKGYTSESVTIPIKEIEKHGISILKGKVNSARLRKLQEECGD